MTAPLERVRLIRQATQGESISSTAILLRIYRSEGWKGFWRGHLVNLSRVVPSYAVRLNVYRTLSDPKSFALSPYLAGALSGLASSLVSYPLDVLRTRMSMGNSLLESFRQRCLFAGSFLTVIETMPYAGLSLGTYTYLTSEPLAFSKPVAGLCAGALATLVCFPLDTLKRNKIVNPEQEILTLTRQLWNYGGPLRFYRGLPVALLKAPPTVAITMVVNEYLQHKLDI